MRPKNHISFNMARVKSAGSQIELLMGRALWQHGLRYRKQYRRIVGRPDFVLVKARVAVFCDSAFWHGRDWKTARKALKTNRAFWLKKLKRNIERDKFVNAELRKQGWKILRFWDDQIKKSPEKCAAKVAAIVKKREAVTW